MARMRLIALVLLAVLVAGCAWWRGNAPEEAKVKPSPRRVHKARPPEATARTGKPELKATPPPAAGEPQVEAPKKENEFERDEAVPLAWTEAATRWGWNNCKVHSVAFSPDNQWLATGGDSHPTSVWEVGKWNEAATLQQPSSVFSVAFSPDGQWLATGGDHSTKVWRVGTWRETATLHHSDSVRSISFSPDGQWIVILTNDSPAKVWSMRAWRETAALGSTSGIHASAFSPDSKWLATCNSDNRARIWGVGTWTEATALQHPDRVSSTVFSPDSQWLATGSDDRIGRVWRVGTWREAAKLRHTHPLLGLAFSPNGRWLITGGAGDTGRVWSVPTWQVAATLKDSGGVCLATFSHGSQWLATVGVDGRTRVWRVGAWELAKSLSVWPSIRSIAFSYDGKWVTTLGQRAKIWHLPAPSNGIAIDWRAGAVTAPPFPRASLQLTTQSPLAAGHPLKARITVSNSDGKGDLFRVLAIVHAPQVKLWHGRKLFFGRVEAGKSFERTLELPTEPAWQSGARKFTLNFQECNHIPPAPVSGEIEIRAQPRPLLSFSFPERKPYGQKVVVRVHLDHSQGAWDLSEFGVNLKVFGLSGGVREAKQTVGQIKQGETKCVDCDFAKWKLDPKQALKLRVECTEARGVTPGPLEVNLEERPVVTLLCSMKDPYPGNSDGIIQRNEPAVCVVRVENEGKTDTGVIRFAATEFTSAPGLKSYGQLTRVLPPLKPKAGHTVSFDVQPSNAFRGKEFAFKVSAEEDLYETRTERQMRLEVGKPIGGGVTQMPALALKVKPGGTNLYAGASERSSYVNTLAAGTVVTVDAKTADFYRVVMEPEKLWVRRDALESPEKEPHRPSVPPPWVSVHEPTARLVAQAQLPIRLTAGASAGLSKLSVFVGSAGDAQTQHVLMGKRQDWTGQIALAKGPNEIQIVVEDQRRQKGTQTLRVRYDPQVGDMYEHAYAVVVGIDTYLDAQVPTLQNAENDARAVEKTLREQFLFTEVRSLYGRAATRTNMERMLFDWLPSVAGPRDAVFVYFACHGLVFNTVGYLVPHDGSNEEKESTRNMSMFRLKEELAKRCRAKDMMVVVTACFGGLLAERAIVPEPHPGGEVVGLKGRKARVVLTAGGPGETVLDWGKGKCSVFTASFLNRLAPPKEESPSKEAYVTGYQVFKHVSEEVARVLANEELFKDKKQKPVFRAWTWPDDPCTGDFVFIRK